MSNEQRPPSPSPKWTVLSLTESESSTWIGTCWEFFDDEAAAQARYEELEGLKRCPTLRPFYGPHDGKHLGAGHDWIDSMVAEERMGQGSREPMTPGDALIVRALAHAGPCRIAHEPACPVQPGFHIVGRDGKPYPGGQPEEACDCWVRDAKAYLVERGREWTAQVEQRTEQPKTDPLLRTDGTRVGDQPTQNADGSTTYSRAPLAHPPSDAPVRFRFRGVDHGLSFDEAHAIRDSIIRAIENAAYPEPATANAPVAMWSLSEHEAQRSPVERLIAVVETNNGCLACRADNHHGIDHMEDCPVRAVRMAEGKTATAPDAEGASLQTWKAAIDVAAVKIRETLSKLRRGPQEPAPEAEIDANDSVWIDEWIRDYGAEKLSTLRETLTTLLRDVRKDERRRISSR